VDEELVGSLGAPVHSLDRPTQGIARTLIGGAAPARQAVPAPVVRGDTAHVFGLLLAVV
jgi:hypothetical protein